MLQLHVVKKVAKIASRRWRLGFGYVDAASGERRPPRTSHHAGPRGLCQVIGDREAGERACQASAGETIRRLIEAARNSDGEPSVEPIRIGCHAGLTELAAPIVIDGRVHGALLCGGFFVAGGINHSAAFAMVDHRTASLALAPAEYLAARDEHPWLDERDLSYVAELVREAALEVANVAAPVVRQSAAGLEEEFATRYSYDAIIGRSGPMQDLYSILDRVVLSDSTVLIQGENGTGKELVARAIHFNSPRKTRRFIVTNCSAFNDNLLDSELFGHTRGAFTGAIADKQGLFEVADQGTFFLDEIGDMSPALQVKVLRVLQEGTFTPVGDTEMRQVDVRIIAATNRDLKGMVDRGEFREDLYYRINVINLLIPPLRERREDIEILFEHFLEKHARHGKSKRLSTECKQLLLSYGWPGNVRELENEVERLVVLSGDEATIGPSLLSMRIREQRQRGDSSSALIRSDSLPEAVKGLERRMIFEALERNKWNKTRASAELKISRRNLIRLVQKYELAPAR